MCRVRCANVRHALCHCPLPDCADKTTINNNPTILPRTNNTRNNTYGLPETPSNEFNWSFCIGLLKRTTDHKLRDGKNVNPYSIQPHILLAADRHHTRPTWDNVKDALEIRLKLINRYCKLATKSKCFHYVSLIVEFKTFVHPRLECFLSTRLGVPPPV